MPFARHLTNIHPPISVLLEAPFEPSRRQKNSVLLAIDLTTAVADEAIRRQDSTIVAYRTSFRSLLSNTNPSSKAPSNIPSMNQCDLSFLERSTN